MAEKQTNRERLKEITDSIERGIQELFQSEKYAQYLLVMSRFHKYSLNNTMLIYLQRPDATVVAGFCMPLLIGCSKDEPASIAFYVTTPIDVENELLDAVSVTLPDGITRQAVSSIQHDFIKDEQQVGGIVILDISSEILDSPVERLFDIVELIRQQLMPNVAAEDAQMISFGGNQNAYMELVTGPDEMLYFHYLFRGVNHTYDVWFNWELLEQNTDMIYEIVSSVAGEDILPENNQNPF